MIRLVEAESTSWVESMDRCCRARSSLSKCSRYCRGEQPNCRANPLFKYLMSEKPQAMLISRSVKSVSRRSWRAFSHRIFIR